MIDEKKVVFLYKKGIPSTKLAIQFNCSRTSLKLKATTLIKNLLM